MFWRTRREPLRVFIHLPKCGGTTIEANLVAHFGDRVFKFFGQKQIDRLRSLTDNKFKDIDFVTIHHPRFKCDKVFKDLDVEYYALVREPIEAMVSLYNFAIAKQHTRHYNNVREMSFWQFFAYSQCIQEWKPNFQSYYLCSSRKYEKQKEFIHRIRPKLWRLEQIENFYASMTGREINKSLVSNVSEKKISSNNLTQIDRRILSALSDVDAKLWSRTNLHSLS